MQGPEAFDRRFNFGAAPLFQDQVYAGAGPGYAPTATGFATSGPVSLNICHKI